MTLVILCIRWKFFRTVILNEAVFWYWNLAKNEHEWYNPYKKKLSLQVALQSLLFSEVILGGVQLKTWLILFISHWCALQWEHFFEWTCFIRYALLFCGKLFRLLFDYLFQLCKNGVWVMLGSMQDEGRKTRKLWQFSSWSRSKESTHPYLWYW